MTSFPTTYNSEAAWKQQQTEQMSQEMDTLDSFQTATSQLLYIMTVMAPSLGEAASDNLAWKARDENVVSQVFDADITTVTNCYNDVISDGAGAPNNLQNVDTAMGAANQALWFAFTCPPFSENTDLQTVMVNNFSDLFCVDPEYSYYSVTVDGETQQVKVPQFDPDGTQYGMPNDEYTEENWTGGAWDAEGGPNSKYYQAYLTQQSGWNQDLTMMSDSCDTLDTQMQGRMQQNETMQKNLDSLWNEMIQEKNKGIASQIQKQISR